MINSLEDIIKELKVNKSVKLAVAAAQDKEVLHAVLDAMNMSIIEPILIGNSEKIKQIAKDLKLNLENIEIIEAKSYEECAKIAVKLVSSQKADFLMKGILDTSILLKQVLNKEYGLRTDSLLSHVMIYEVPNYHKLLIFSDGGMNIKPTYEQKEKIVLNAVKACKSLNIDNIKIAALAAKEKVDEKMQATVDAKKLQEASEAGLFGENVIIEGPLAFDLAISSEASKVKGFKSEISGDVDVILVPTIEVGNGIGKSLTYLANAKSAGVIMGAKTPIVLVSRADSHESKLYSIAYGALIAMKAR
ncbi:bifunctional enoyl-CoA hydratase/phosphate acetyltransferase [Paraclostridium ghonii]|uniref:bifunctional enoyl-CoA hydratase/phosphate acetyltransferase n=1 Tax=Paraclostridium ghonii TaxID=29358 RepID=UPI00202D0964|nr:bifunctional enoyl-CoA hydratase/phosphate acetyltransferase [Paeniclostridium ghonii]MCM0165799.1 bifunctional enoyl-CoA hydratase/phosphate acetyltransferase [Paeniclostridium ghonii]